jgi:dTDP-4-amino-4,6-dideoxygalactose transaminase
MKEFIPWGRPDIGEEEVQAVADAVRSTWIGGNGPLTVEFEEKIQQKLNVDHALAVSNGTVALMCAIQAQSYLNRNIELCIGVPSFTFIATVNAAATIGSAVLFDIDRKTWNMEKYIISVAKKKRRLINVVMPVDVGGNPVNYSELRKLNLPIIADSAEAMGATYKGRMVGSQADAHCFSLHSTKVITTGEGGLITTNDDDLYEMMCALTNQGYRGRKKSWEYLHRNIGYNYRMTEMQAALGLVQLKKLDRYVKERTERAKIYQDVIGSKVEYQTSTKSSHPSHFIFGMLVKNQTEFCEKMLRNNVQVKVTFRPVHKQPCYKDIFPNEVLPESEWIADNVVSLPMWNGLSEEQTKEIAELARRFVE